MRVIATSNRDLVTEVAAQRFRQDLFYRLNVLPVTMPALREHPDDIAELSEHFLGRVAVREGKSKKDDRAAGRCRCSSGTAGRATCASSRTSVSGRRS